jgi:hypothetical protein
MFCLEQERPSQYHDFYHLRILKGQLGFSSQVRRLKQQVFVRKTSGGMKTKILKILRFEYFAESSCSADS